MKSLNQNKTILLLNLFLLIAISVILFLYPTLIGTDIFYHLKITQLIQNDGLKIINNLPWFQYTSWSQFPADLSLGFHLLLLPWLLFFSPIVAIKILVLILLLILANLFFYFLKKEQVKYSLLWLTLLFIASPFFFYRLFLFRPFLISIILSLALLFALHNKKYFQLFIYTAIYCFCYSGWLQVLIMVFVYTLVNWMLAKKLNLKYLLYILLALTLALIIRPDFPNILILTFQQIFGLLYSNLIKTGVAEGVEQSPANFYFLLHNLLIYLLYFGALFVTLKILKPLKDVGKKSFLVSLLILATFYGFWVFESIRFIEYFVPLTILLLALALTYYSELKTNNIINPQADNEIILKIKTVLTKPFWKIYLTLAALSLIYYPIHNVLNDFKTTTPIDKYKTTALWLKDNTPEKSIIFHASWDAFPRLFYYNSHNYYIVGLDSIFMYLNNPKLYWLWRNITENQIACDFKNFGKCLTRQKEPLTIALTIKKLFNSEYIWLNQADIFLPFKKILENNPEYFEKKIETSDSSVFKIINAD